MLADRRYRHHIVYTDLEPGWHDCDEVLLYACMAVLCRFVEWEVPGTGGCHIVPPEAAEIHRWWRIDRPAELDAIDALLADAYRWPEMHEREERLRATETEMICRIAKIRELLWT